MGPKIYSGNLLAIRDDRGDFDIGPFVSLNCTIVEPSEERVGATEARCQDDLVETTDDSPVDELELQVTYTSSFG